MFRLPALEGPAGDPFGLADSMMPCPLCRHSPTILRRFSSLCRACFIKSFLRRDRAIRTEPEFETGRWHRLLIIDSDHDPSGFAAMVREQGVLVMGSGL